MDSFTFNRQLIPDYLEFDQGLNYMFDINTYDFPQLHTHQDYWEFTILTEGTLNHHINGQVETYPKNTLFFCTTKDSHYLKSATSERVRYINIMVREQHLLNLLNTISPTFANALLNGKRHFIIPNGLLYSIEELLHKINLLPSLQFRAYYNDLLCSATLLILQHLFTSMIEFQPEVTGEQPEWLITLKSISQNKAFLTYSVQDLCKKLNYSRMQLNRLFKAHLNTTPHDYLIDHKLRYAKNMLRNTKLKLLDIAMTTGYATLSQFNINFKKKFGMTPGEYRKLAKSPIPLEDD